MARRGWWLVLAAAVVLALVSLASNVTTVSQLEGRADLLLAGRLTLSQLINAGSVWAGLAGGVRILAAGRRRRQAEAGLPG
jgi:hypothetical protein